MAVVKVSITLEVANPTVVEVVAVATTSKVEEVAAGRHFFSYGHDLQSFANDRSRTKRNETREHSKNGKDVNLRTQALTC